jgi:hypothetical protein
MILDLIICFVPAYVGSDDTPDSTLEDQVGGSGVDDLDFDFLHGLLPQVELGGSQLGGAPPTWTQQGEGAQPGGSQLPGASGGTQLGGSQLPGASGGAQPSPGGLPGSSQEVTGSAAARRHRNPLLMLGADRSTHVTRCCTPRADTHRDPS